MFLKTLIHGLGLQLRSTATCTQVQCYQFGIFDVQAALLKRDWNLENILMSMNNMRRLLGKHRYLLKQKDPILRQYFDK